MASITWPTSFALIFGRFLLMFRLRAGNGMKTSLKPSAHWLSPQSTRFYVIRTWALLWPKSTRFYVLRTWASSSSLSLPGPRWRVPHQEGCQRRPTWFFIIVIMLSIKVMLILILMLNVDNVTRGSKIVRMKMPTTLTTVCISFGIPRNKACKNCHKNMTTANCECLLPREIQTKKHMICTIHTLSSARGCY